MAGQCISYSRFKNSVAIRIGLNLNFGIEFCQFLNEFDENWCELQISAVFESSYAVLKIIFYN
jgi:hypothetical protein